MMLELQTEEIKEQKSLFGVNTDEEAEMEIDELRHPKSLFDLEPEQGEEQMQTLGLCDEPKIEKRKGFWRRQFQAEPTRRQKQFDWAFGVIMPVVCIFFDPVVFKFWGEPGGGFLREYKPFAYAGSFISILLMMAWLLWREKLGGFGALFSGVFFVAAWISLVIGIVLLPFSLIGIFFYLIGLLGFTPLFTSVIFLRNGVRALNAAKPNLTRRILVYASILGGLWGLAIPYSLHAEVNRSLELIAKGTPGIIRTQGLKLRLLAPIVNAEQLEKIYGNTSKDSPQREEIKRLYFKITGKDIRPWYD